MISPLEQLHRDAERVGAVLVLTSTADRRDSTGHRYLSSGSEGRLSRLAVVRPNRDAPTRWSQLQTGAVLAHAVVDELPLCQAAVLLLTQIQPHIRRRQAT